MLADLSLAEWDLVRLCLPTADADTSVGLEISVSWAMRRPAVGATERAAVAFRPPDIAVLDEAARVLSDRQERTDEEIQGYVSRLARDRTDPNGTATIKAFVDGMLVSVRVVFDSAELQRDHACA